MIVYCTIYDVCVCVGGGGGTHQYFSGGPQSTSYGPDIAYQLQRILYSQPHSLNDDIHNSQKQDMCIYCDIIIRH